MLFKYFIILYFFQSGEVNPINVTSTLSSDGVLTITAPRKALPAPETERTVPITQVGAQSSADSSKVAQS